MHTEITADSQPLDRVTDWEVKSDSMGGTNKTNITLWATPIDVMAFLEEATIHCRRCSKCGLFGCCTKCETPDCNGEMTDVTMYLTEIVAKQKESENGH
jgi:hypothetical protein